MASVIGACPHVIPKPVYLNWYAVCCLYFHRCLRCLTKSFIPAFPGRHKALVVQNFLWWLEKKNASSPTSRMTKVNEVSEVPALELIHLWFRQGWSNHFLPLQQLVCDSVSWCIPDIPVTCWVCGRTVGSGPSVYLSNDGKSINKLSTLDVLISHSDWQQLCKRLWFCI